VPQLLPFRGIRYARSPDAGAGPVDLTPLAAPPYDVIDDPALLESRHRLNAVRLILPRAQPPADPYEGAARRLATWRADGVLTTDAQPRLYRYAMEVPGPDGRAVQTVGVIGALGVTGDDLLPHERTLAKARSDRLALLRATRANLDPIWVLSLTPGLTELIGPEDLSLASADDDDGAVHRLGVIVDPRRADAIAAAVASTPVVIADGHHRFETARAYAAEHPDDLAAAAVMALVVECAEDQLHVGPIHRVFTGMPPDIRPRLAEAFTVEPAGATTPTGLAALTRRMGDEEALGLVDRDGLALLRPAPELWRRLEAVPEPLRGVDAARVDAGVMPAAPGAHVAYRGDDEASVAAAVVRGDADAAVLLRPVSVSQIRAAAGAGVRMPEKTSYFWPKPRTGMVFRSLDS
jgi:uncharacterized protein (DUF1015 family)